MLRITCGILFVSLLTHSIEIKHVYKYYKLEFINDFEGALAREGSESKRASFTKYTNNNDRKLVSGRNNSRRCLKS